MDACGGPSGMNETLATSSPWTNLAQMRGPRIPKRVVEGWVGAAVQAVGVGAGIWGSTFRRVDGVGIQPTSDLLLLQCSAAERRTWGLSTRVNRQVLATYMANPSLRSWEEHAQFVLPSVAEGDLTVSLWLISAEALAVFAEKQGRCTINDQALAELVARGAASRLEDILRSWSSRQSVLCPPSEMTDTLPIGEASESYEFARFDFNAPTPLGLARNASRYSAISGGSIG